MNEPPEGGYVAEALGQSIFTVAETLEELNEMVRDAVMCHFEEESRPKIISLHSGCAANIMSPCQTIRRSLPERSGGS